MNDLLTRDDHLHGPGEVGRVGLQTIPTPGPFGDVRHPRVEGRQVVRAHRRDGQQAVSGEHRLIEIESCRRIAHCRPPARPGTLNDLPGVMHVWARHRVCECFIRPSLWQYQKNAYILANCVSKNNTARIFDNLRYRLPLSFPLPFS